MMAFALVCMFRKKSEAFFEVRLPIIPFVTAGKLAVDMRNLVSIQRIVQRAVGLDEMIFRAAVKAEWA